MLVEHNIQRRQFLTAAAGAAAFSVVGPRVASAQALDFAPIPKTPMQTITFGVGGTEPEFTYLPMWLAKYGGYFEALKADGINVELVSFPGGAEAILAVASGRVPLMYQSYENAIRARAQGRDVTMIYSSTVAPGPVIVVRKDLADKVRTPADTKGLRWGVTGLGASTHAISMRIASHFGVDPSTISWTPVGGMSGTMPALRDKRIDVLAASITARNILVREGVAVEIFNPNPREVARQLFGHDYLALSVLSTKAYCDANSYIVLRILEAVRKATDKIRTSSGAEILKMMPPMYDSPTSVASIEEMARNLSPDGHIDVDAAVKMVDDLKDLKLTRGKLDAAGGVDNRFVDEINKRLGK